MAAVKLVYWGALGAMLGGLAFVADSLLILSGPEADWTNFVYVVAALLVLVGLLGLNALQRENQDRLGQTGFYIVVAAFLGQVLGILVFMAGSSVLEWLVFPVGFLAVPIGLVLYGIATLRAGVLPRWCGIALIAVPLLGVVLGDAGEILFGLLWLALGYMLWTKSRVSVEQPRVQ